MDSMRNDIIIIVFKRSGGGSQIEKAFFLWTTKHKQNLKNRKIFEKVINMVEFRFQIFEKKLIFRFLSKTSVLEK